MERRYAAALIGAAITIGACAELPRDTAARGAEDGAPPAAADAIDRGAVLFANHCAVCHGPHGTGRGPAYGSLFPRARDFSAARFRLVGTDNGVPSESDLMHTLRRGMPGSAMPSWEWMTEADLRSLAGHVRRLAVEGLTHRLRDAAWAAGDASAMRSARLDAEAALEPGKPLAPVGAVEATPERLERGRELYAAQCARCHGEDGRGDPRPLVDADGTLNWARDFTAGYLKGGASADALADRIRAGLPGTAMPATSLPEPDLKALVAYVGELVPDGAEDRLVHHRVRVVAKRVEGPLPMSADDAVWAGAGEVRMTLAPLTWREQTVHAAWLAALHDGASIAVRVRWPDATGDPRVATSGFEADGVALQLSADPSPPLFGMGGAERPTNLWHWKATRFDDVAGSLDLYRAPHAVGEPFRTTARPDLPLYERRLGAPHAEEGGDALVATGAGRTGRIGEPGRIGAHPSWRDGQWSVVFTRGLAPERDGEVDLVAGAPLRLSVAVWNGAAGDRGGQKSISIWHDLEVATE